MKSTEREPPSRKSLVGFERGLPLTETTMAVIGRQDRRWSMQLG